MNKPAFLYHGSSNPDIDVLEPRAASVRDATEGPVVFASPDEILVTMFLVPTDDRWTRSGLFGGVHYYVCSNEEEFKKLDKGGAIYKLPSDSFENDLTKGLGTREWTSKVPVKPLSKKIVASALDEMINLGVQVYFVDETVFKRINESRDHGNEILRNSTSENSKQGRNVKKLPVVSD